MRRLFITFIISFLLIFNIGLVLVMQNMGNSHHDCPIAFSEVDCEKGNSLGIVELVLQHLNEWQGMSSGVLAASLILLLIVIVFVSVLENFVYSFVKSFPWLRFYEWWGALKIIIFQKINRWLNLTKSSSSDLFYGYM